MNTSRSADRALYSLVGCILATIALWAGVVAIGLYYFAVDQAIPSIVDHIQFGMLVLAGLCGVTAVAMFVLFVVLTARRRE